MVNPHGTADADYPPPTPATRMLPRIVSADSMWSVRDAADYLNTSERFVRDHWRELGGVKIGGTKGRAGLLRFTKEAIDRYLERSRLAG